MKRLISALLRIYIPVVAILSASVFAQTEQPRVDVSHKPASPAVWKKRSPAGKELGDVDFAPPAQKVVGYQTPKDAPKGRAEKRELYGSKPLVFSGEDTFYSAVEEVQRGENVYVELKIRPAAAASPETGTVINVDGAVFSFAEIVTGGKRLLELVTLDSSKRWMRSGILVTVRNNVAGAPLICVKLDHKNRVWTLFSNGVPIDEYLPLQDFTGMPTVSIRPGRDQNAALEHLKVTDRAPGNGRFGRVPSVDLQRAHEAGVKHIVTDGEKLNPPGRTPPTVRPPLGR